MRWLVAERFKAVSVKLLVQGQPKIKQETYFMVIVLWGVTTSGRAETLPMLRRNFLLGYMDMEVLHADRIRHSGILHTHGSDSIKFCIV